MEHGIWPNRRRPGSDDIRGSERWPVDAVKIAECRLARYVCSSGSTAQKEQPMASVSFERVEKAYGTTKVIHGVGFDIHDGEFMVLVGPSGCGKSTLLRMLAGLEEIDGGAIAIDGKVVNDTESKDRDIAMVFQSYALYPHMTVRANMAFSLKLRKADAAVIAERVAKASKILNLDAYLERFPRELSGGQRQRVAMGRAIVRDPKVFLFDEPLSNLDAKLRVAMRAEIKALHQRLKTTTVYVTHDQVEAMTMADRIAVMNEGRIEQLGAPLELYDRPANLFVAQFIGSPAMNVLDGTLKNGSVEALGARWPAPQNRGTDGQAVKYGIRPEHLQLGRDGVPAEVVVVEPMGHETELLVRINDIDLIVVMQGRSAHAPGERIFLAPQAANAHLFDAASGRRI